MKHKTRLIIIATTIFLLAVLIGTYYATKAVNSFFDKNFLAYHPFIQVKVQQPVTVETRPLQKVVEKKIILEYPDEIDTPLEVYICEKFGTYECKTALAIAKAESGMREEAFNINTNNTIDVGVYQINSIHFTKPGCSLKEIVIAEKNVDCAYTIWKASGWNPWVAFTRGSYLGHL